MSSRLSLQLIRFGRPLFSSKKSRTLLIYENSVKIRLYCSSSSAMSLNKEKNIDLNRNFIEQLARLPVKDPPSWVRTEAQLAIFTANNFDMLKEICDIYKKFTHKEASSFLSKIVALTERDENHINKESKRQIARDFLVELDYSKTLCKSLLSPGSLEYIVSALTALIALDIDDATREQLMRMFTEKLDDFENEPVSPFITFAVYQDVHKVALSDEFRAKLDNVLNCKLSEVSHSCELLPLFIHVRPESQEWLSMLETKAEDLLSRMNPGECIALLTTLAKINRRNVTLLKAIVTTLKSFYSPLTVNQLMTLSLACSKLNFYDSRVTKRLKDDLKDQIVEIPKWSIMSSLTTGLNGLKFGDSDTWTRLLDWITANLNAASLIDLSIVISAISNCNVQDERAKLLGRHLADMLDPIKAKSASNWLRTVHSLAVLNCLTHHLAHSVLRPDFVTAILGRIETRTLTPAILHIKLSLMQINAAAKLDLLCYSGPFLDLQNDPRFVLDRSAIDIMTEIKYAKSMRTVQKSMLLTILYTFAPLTHSLGPQLNPDGIYLDAVLCPGAEGRFLPVKDWSPDKRRIALMLFGYFHTTQMVDDDDPPRLLGSFALNEKHLRKRGFAVAKVFDYEISGQLQNIQKIDFLQRKLKAAANDFININYE